MKTICNVFLFIILPICVSYGQDTIPEVQGWKNAKWGMTKEEVQKALEGQVEKDFLGHLVIKNLKIGSDLYDATFGWDKFTESLTSVRLAPAKSELEAINKEKVPSYLQGDVEGYLYARYYNLFQNRFESLEKGLTKKYGVPIYKQDNEKPRQYLDKVAGQIVRKNEVEIKRERTWKLKLTTIELYLWVSKTGPKHLFVRYKKAEDDLEDNL
jgi:hypothetical protein